MNYQFDTDAVIRSLHVALTTRRDFSASRTRLLNAINRLPEGSLQICHPKKKVLFYMNKKYLSKRSDLLYALARKRYCLTLLKTIDAFETRSPTPQQYKKKCDEAFAKLEKLIRDYSAGHLQLDRILFSNQQYKWLHGRHIKKTPPDYDNLRIPQGDSVRTKSEQQIGIELHLFAVPCIYELRLQLNVQNQVRTLEADLRKDNLLHGALFTHYGYTCVWNVPKELAWMNAPSSVWRSYDPRTGCITLHPDYTIMLADGSLLYWEHEGLLIHFNYRTNALERIHLIKQSGVPGWRIIETEEFQANDRSTLSRIIETRIAPYIWF